MSRFVCTRAHVVVGLSLLAVLIVSAVIARDRKVRAAETIKDKYGHVWPECVPPESSELPSPVWTIDSTPYHCSATGNLVVDKAAVDRYKRADEARHQLLSALGDRKLTHAEMLNVYSRLNVDFYEPFFSCQKSAALYDVLVKQWTLQTNRKLDMPSALSGKLGMFNNCPQETDNLHTVDQLIAKLQMLSSEQP